MDAAVTALVVLLVVAIAVGLLGPDRYRSGGLTLSGILIIVLIVVIVSQA